MSSADPLAAVLIGLGGGLRSFATPTALALHGRGPFAGAARTIAFGAAAGELIADKQPSMASRWSPRGLSLRVVFSAGAGRDAAGPRGAALAAGCALAAAFAGSRLRTARPGLRLAFAEDALSYGLVLAGAHRLG